MGPRRRKRDRFTVVNAATRAALQRAMKAGLTQREWRVLAAVIANTSTYSRLTDEVSVARIVVETGIKDPKAVVDALRGLEEKVGLVYRPGGGRHKRSEVGFRVDETGVSTHPPLGDETGVPTHPPLGDDENKRGSLGPRNGGAWGIETGVSTHPLPKKTYQEDLESMAEAKSRDEGNPPLPRPESARRAGELARKLQSKQQQQQTGGG